MSMLKDFRAVNIFSGYMREKMSISAEKGRCGWDDPEQCSLDDLANMLVAHVAKGDPVDIANFCMMLHQREQALIKDDPHSYGIAGSCIRAAWDRRK